MAKKIPSASINITSALRSILTQSDVKSSVVDQNRLINSKIRVTGGAFAAAGNILSPIDHVAISYAGSTFRVTAADLISAVIDNIKVTMNYGIKPRDFVSNISDRIKTFSVGKGLKDFAPATESIKIAMGYSRAFTDVQSTPLDRRFIGSSKTIRDITSTSDLAARGFVKSRKDFVANIDSTSRSLTKSLRDFVIPLDYMTVTDGSTFSDVKVIKDVQPAIDNLSRAVSYNRAYQDTQLTADRPFKGLFKSFADFVTTEDVLDFNRLKETAADDTFNVSDANIRGVVKSLRDTAIPLDYMTITDGSTFSDIKALSDIASVADFRSIDYTKSTKEFQVEFEGPAYGDINDYSPDYFLDNYTEQFRPIWNFNKAVADFVIPLDYMTIADGSTFEDIKRLPPEFIAISDAFRRTVNFIRKPNDFVSTSDDGNTYSIIKVFKDYTVALDYMTIADGSTFSDVKVLSDTAPPSDLFTKVLIFGRRIIDTVIADSNSAFTFTATKREILEEPQDGSGHDTYAFDYFLDGSDPYFYANKWLPIINFEKSVKDFVIPLDYMTIADGSTFEDIKRIFDTVTVPDRIPLDVTKPFKETVDKFEGPGFGSQDDFSFNYFLDDYTTDPRPIWTIYKPFAEPLNLIEVFTLSYTPIRKFVETMTVSDFGRDVFDLTKRFFDTVGTLDETTITDGGEFRLFKTFVETLRAIEGPATRFLEDYTGSEWTDPTYIEDHIPVYTILKPLSDSVIPLDYMTIADGSTFEDIKPIFDTVTVSEAGQNTFDLTKPQAEVQPFFEGPAYGDINDYSPEYFLDKYTEDFRPIWTIYKPFADSVIPLDYMTIADGSTFSDVKPIVEPPLIVNSFSSWNWLKTKDEVLSVSDAGGDVFNLNKQIFEYKKPVEGPAYHDYTWYAIDYFDDPYAEWYGSIFSFNKILPNDVQPALDHNAVTFQPATKNDFVSTSDFGNVFDFNKFKADSVSLEDYGTLYSLTKVLADSVIPLDYMTITDGSTFEDIKRLPPEFVGVFDDGNVFNFNKAKNDFVSNIEDYGTLFTLEKVLGDSVRPKEGPALFDGDDYVPDWTDPAYLDDGKPSYNIIKVLPTDFAIALDYMTIADGSTFDYINVLPPDFVFNISDDGNVFDFNKAKAELQPATDVLQPFTTNLAKKEFIDQQQGPVYKDYTQYSPDYFLDNYTEYFNISYTFVKVLPTDFAIALDYMTIADGSTFDYINVLPPDFVTDTSDFTTTHPTKALTSSNTGTSDLLLPFTFIKGLADEVFAEEVLRIQQPLRADKDNPQIVPPIDDDIFNFNKRVSSSAIPLDYMTIADGSTFSDVKILRSVNDSPFDGSGHDNYAYNYFDDPYYYALRLIPIFEFTKALADSVIPLDYMTIADGSTFSDIKVLATLQPAPLDANNKATGKVLGSIQQGVEDNGNVFNFNKVLADFQRTRQGPGENNASDYAYDGVGDYGTPVWMDPSYIDDSRAVFNLIKVFSDSVIPLDYLTIVDGSTFEDIKRLSSSVTTPDNGNIFDLTKPLTDRSYEFEGPRRGTISDFSPDYFLDDYTEDLRPIWTLYKALSDSVIPLDYMTIADGSTFSDVKPLPPEFVTANSFSSFDWTKTKSETMVASDVFFPLILNLAKREVLFAPQGPVYKDYTQYSGDYFADNYAEYFNLKYSFTKVLSDTAIALDYMTIVDGSTFSDSKILPPDFVSNVGDKATTAPTKALRSSNTGTSDLLLPFTFIKGINDFVSTIDDLAISQPYVLDRNDPQRVNQLDNDTFNLNKGLRELVPLEDYGTLYTFSKILSDSIRAKEGPGDNNADDYVNTWTDPSYIDDGRPTYNYIKVLPADYVTALDYMTIADGSTFSDVKILSSTVSNISDNGNVFNFNKAPSDLQSTSDALLPFTTGLVKRDTVIQPQGPVYYNKAGYAPDFFNDDYTEFFGPKYTFIKVLPTDYAIALDYMTIADGSTFTEVKALSSVNPPPTDRISAKAPTKALKDTQSGQGDGNFHSQHLYAADYFDGSSAENTFQYTVEYRPTIVLNKVKSDTVTEVQGPAYYDSNIYSVGYFPAGQDYMGYQGPTFSWIKPLRTTQSTATAGNIYKNNYVAGAFFATDFIGNAYTIA